MTKETNIYAVILAGGSGTRFWPKSRHLKPKQLCAIGPTDQTMIERTMARLDGFIPPERRIVVTHEKQLSATKDILTERCHHYLAEPEARNTAAALTLAALEIQHLSKSEDAVMISLHADHLIDDEDQFRDDLKRAVGVAQQGYLTLLGVHPRYPETGYGYIEVGSEIADAQQFQGHHVASFREKPDLERAKAYLAQGNYLWNSGYFVWRIDVILNEVRAHLSPTYTALHGLCDGGQKSFNAVAADKLSSVYASLPKIAIDNAVLEASANVAVLRTEFGWYDVGSWDAMLKCFPVDADGNFTAGDIFQLDCKNSVVESMGPFVAAIGLEDIVVVAANDAVLVCPKDRAQDVKKIVEFLTEQGRTTLL